VIRGLAVLALVGCGGAQRSAAVCPRGDVVVTSQESAAELRGCAVVAGDLRIRTGAALDLSALAAVERVAGDLVIGPTLGLDTVATLGALREVAGTVRLVANGDVGSAFFPALVRAGGVEVDGNLALVQVMFPALREVAGDVIVRGNSMLELVDAGSLTTVGGALVIERNPALAQVWVTRPRATEVRVIANPALDAAVQSTLIESAAPAAGP
jgi:hypothetical protein